MAEPIIVYSETHCLLAENLNPSKMDSLLSATSLSLLRATYWQCDTQWFQAPRRLGDSMWYYFYRGHGRCCLGDNLQEHRFRVGSLFVIPHGDLHAVYPDEQTKVETVTVHFHARFHGSTDLLKLLALGGVIEVGKTSPWAKGSLTLAEEYRDQRIGWQWAMQSTLRSLLVHLLRRQNLPQTPTSTLRALYALQPVFEQIKNRLHEPELRIAALAGVLNVSEVYLRRLFGHAGLPAPAEFVRRRRIDHACTLLQTTDLPIKHLASQCGFNDLPLFYRRFKAQVHTTPKLFRKHPEP